MAGTFDPLSPEVVYALKGNIVLPNTDPRTGSAVATLAQNRIIDGNTAITAITITAVPKANQ